jgi:HK97 family phage portal protein
MENASTLFSIVDGIASGVAAAEWGLFKGTGPNDPDAVPVDAHPALTLWKKPNPFFTQSEYVEAMQQHYELTGEYWWVMSYQGSLRGRSVTSKFPLEMWVIRPDRIRPVQSKTDFISGFLYRQGSQEVPLSLTDVVFNKRQNPRNPYRGMSPIQALMYDLEGEKAAAQYNATFFSNGAEPGGIIEANPASNLSDPEFKQLMERWNHEHKGVKNAHRVAYLEQGKWVPRQYTRRDMQFVDLRNFAKDTIREAYRFPKSMMGSESSSNRATFEAEKAVFAENLLVPRLRKLRSSLNDDLLPLFGALGEGYFFDFEDPSPEDRENSRAERDSAVSAAAALIGLGFDPAEVLEAVDLPPLTFTQTTTGGATQ